MILIPFVKILGQSSQAGIDTVIETLLKSHPHLAHFQLFFDNSFNTSFLETAEEEVRIELLWVLLYFLVLFVPALGLGLSRHLFFLFDHQARTELSVSNLVGDSIKVILFDQLVGLDISVLEHEVGDLVVVFKAFTAWLQLRDVHQAWHLVLIISLFDDELKVEDVYGIVDACLANRESITFDVRLLLDCSKSRLELTLE